MAKNNEYRTTDHRPRIFDHSSPWLMVNGKWSTVGLFEDNALSTFRFQYQNCEVYKQFCDALKITPQQINSIDRIPFLPVEFYKTHKIISKNISPENHPIIFSSSGTTSQTLSKHYISDISVYEQSFRKGFEFFYGNLEDYCLLALLPSYLERQDSSLVFMVNNLIQKTKNPDSGFYLHNLTELSEKLKYLSGKNQKFILLGVSYALLDLAEMMNTTFLSEGGIVMETGGMKGKHKEMLREELHTVLKKAFGKNEIHSEYGMTELLSQSYSKGNGLFKCPPWMQILIRDIHDPFHIIENGKTGGINVIDLANINSCSFIATQDLGKLYNDGSFEITGRFDAADIRGCNLMAE